ncbi:MAG: endonuclease domain-containing protein, partial [Bacteroidota bacterium]
MPSERYTNRPRQKPIRKRLRQDATPAERRLWRIVRAKRLDGHKFRRQHGIGPYVLDFYCADAKLAIELDGAVHADPQRAAYDAERQRDLEALGVRVLRFENRAVTETPDVVAEAILAVLNGEVGIEPLPVTPSRPPPSGGGGHRRFVPFHHVRHSHATPCPDRGPPGPERRR